MPDFFNDTQCYNTMEIYYYKYKVKKKEEKYCHFENVI